MSNLPKAADERTFRAFHDVVRAEGEKRAPGWFASGGPSSSQRAAPPTPGCRTSVGSAPSRLTFSGTGYGRVCSRELRIEVPRPKTSVSSGIGQRAGLKKT